MEKFAKNMVVIMIKEYGNKVVCNKHFRKDYHRSTGQFTSKDCDCCVEVEQRCAFEDIGL